MSAPSCSCYVNWDGKPPRCGKPATTVIRGGCVHEHVSESPVCTECGEKIRFHAKVAGGMFCTPCQRGPDSHHCPVLPKWVPLGVPA